MLFFFYLRVQLKDVHDFLWSCNSLSNVEYFLFFLFLYDTEMSWVVDTARRLRTTALGNNKQHFSPFSDIL